MVDSDTISWAVAAFGVAIIVIVLVAFARAGFPPTGVDHGGNPEDERHPLGPTGTPYPPGSRPAGPDAEGMNVAGAGEIIPGPDPTPGRDDPT